MIFGVTDANGVARTQVRRIFYGIALVVLTALAVYQLFHDELSQDARPLVPTGPGKNGTVSPRVNVVGEGQSPKPLSVSAVVEIPTADATEQLFQALSTRVRDASEPWSAQLRRDINSLPIVRIIDLLTAPGIAGGEDADQLVNRVILICGRLGSIPVNDGDEPLREQCSVLLEYDGHYMDLMREASTRLAENDDARYRTIPLTDADRELIIATAESRVSSGNPELAFLGVRDLTEADPARYFGAESQVLTSADRRQIGYALASLRACQVEANCGPNSLWTLQYCVNLGVICTPNLSMEAQIDRNLSAAQREIFVRALRTLTTAGTGSEPP